MRINTTRTNGTFVLYCIFSSTGTFKLSVTTRSIEIIRRAHAFATARTIRLSL